MVKQELPLVHDFLGLSFIINIKVIAKSIENFLFKNMSYYLK